MSTAAPLSPDDRRRLLERVIVEGVDVVAGVAEVSIDTIARALVGRRVTTLVGRAIRDACRVRGAA